MKGLVVYWKVTDRGGGEYHAKVTADALGCKVISLVYKKNKNRYNFINVNNIASPIYNIPFLRKVPFIDYLKWSSISLPNIEDYDYIVSFGARARSLITPETTVHIHYLLSVERWLYDTYHIAMRRRGILKSIITPMLAEITRLIDSSIDKRVDYYIANSDIISRRLWKYMKRESVVVYPPIFFNNYKHKYDEGYYLFITRLYPQKRVREVCRAFAKLGKDLVICGEGPERKIVEYYAEEYLNIKYMGYVTEEEKIDLLARCRAVVYPAIGEDFGLAPIEALASGKPVIVSDTGFPPLLVKKYKCGVICDGSVEGIIDAVNRLELQLKSNKYNPKYLRDIAKKFDYHEYYVPTIRHVVKEFVKKYNETIQI